MIRLKKIYSPVQFILLCGKREQKSLLDVSLMLFTTAPYMFEEQDSGTD
jgi:hypothetical protein